MVSAETAVVDYRIVPAEEVNHYLAEGFVLYGTPMCYPSTTSTSVPSFYQSLIKTQAVPKRTTFAPHLSQIERRCVTLLAQGNTTAEIATAVYHTTRTVRNILLNLRHRFGCKTNERLIVILERAGLFPHEI